MKPSQGLPTGVAFAKFGCRAVKNSCTRDPRKKLVI